MRLGVTGVSSTGTMSEQIAQWCSWLFLHACYLMWHESWCAFRHLVKAKHRGNQVRALTGSHVRFYWDSKCFPRNPIPIPEDLSSGLTSQNQVTYTWCGPVTKNSGKSGVRTHTMAWTKHNECLKLIVTHSELNTESVSKIGAQYRHWVGNYLSPFWVSILRIRKSFNK